MGYLISRTLTSRTVVHCTEVCKQIVRQYSIVFINIVHNKILIQPYCLETALRGTLKQAFKILFHIYYRLLM